MLCVRSSTLLLQKTLLVQAWRPFAFWACVSADNDELIQKVKVLNAGCAVDREVIRPATFKEFGVLTVQDLQTFNVWLVAEDKPGYREVKDQLCRLRHRRWCWWHVMAPDNPNVAAECSMPLSNMNAWHAVT